jgi:tRNA threonylcarbamoyl adenosine modification protein YeaZ
MKLLAIDTSQAAVSACIMGDDGGILARETLPMARGHAEALLPLLERLSKAAAVPFSTLGRIAVVVGPGSFTGIRIGIAAGRAIGLAAGVPVVGVSSLAAFAAPLIGREGAGVIAAAVDAKHGQVYVQGFTAKGQPLAVPRITNVRDAVRTLGAGPLVFAGSGATMMAIEAWSLGAQAEVAGETITPDIGFVARLGVLADPATAPARPYYLKPPDAKPQANGAIARTA